MKKILWMLVMLLAATTMSLSLANGSGTATFTPAPIHLVSVTLNSGSLRGNIEKIAHTNGWQRVVWNNKNDYTWIGQTKITGTSFIEIMGKIIKDYPLQAVFYNGNHVLVIQPRTIQ